MKQPKNIGNQAIELANKKLVPDQKSAETEVLFNDRNCVICEEPFRAKRASRVTTCSDACARERRLRYGAAYRQDVREMRVKIIERFGGRMPTDAEILSLYWKSRGYDTPPLGPEYADD